VNGFDRAFRIGKALWLIGAGALLVGLFGWFLIYMIWEVASGH
jgi:cell division septal protein FtsQ